MVEESPVAAGRGGETGGRRRGGKVPSTLSKVELSGTSLVKSLPLLFFGPNDAGTGALPSSSALTLNRLASAVIFSCPKWEWSASTYASSDPVELSHRP